MVPGLLLVSNKDQTNRARRVLSTVMGVMATRPMSVVPGGGSKCPITPDNVDQRLNTISMLGRDVYKYAVNAMKHACEQALAAAGRTADDVSTGLSLIRRTSVLSKRLSTGSGFQWTGLLSISPGMAIPPRRRSRLRLMKPTALVRLSGETSFCSWHWAGLNWAASVVGVVIPRGMDLIDTHAHLASKQLQGETDAILHRSRLSGVTQIVSIGTG